MRAWRDSWKETEEVLRDLRACVPVEAEVVIKVFATRPVSDWSDAEILRWRALSIRRALITRCAWLMAQEAAACGELPRSKGGIAIPDVGAIATMDERDLFRSMYFDAMRLIGILGAHSDSSRRQEIEAALASLRQGAGRV